MQLNNKQTGFTIIELLLTVAIVAIVMGWGVPSFKDFYKKKRVIAAAEAVYGHIQKARTESIARSSDIFIEFDASGNYGSRTTINCEPAQDDPTNAAACFLSVDANGDGDTDDAGEKVLNRVLASDFRDVVISGNDIQFEPRRGMLDGAGNTMTITHEDDSALELNVVVGKVGRIKICSDGSTKIPGYPDCP